MNYIGRYNSFLSLTIKALSRKLYTNQNDYVYKLKLVFAGLDRDVCRITN